MTGRLKTTHQMLRGAAINKSAGETSTPFDPISEAFRRWVLHGLDEPLAMAAAISIIHAQQVVTTAVDRALKPLGITFAQHEVLMLLSFAKKDGVPTLKIARGLQVHPTGVTKLIDKLEGKGLAARLSNPLDRRGTLVRITPTGRDLSKQASKLVAAVRFGVDLPDRELRQIIELLGRVRAPSLP